jgi:hypothetical protein
MLVLMDYPRSAVFLVGMVVIVRILGVVVYVLVVFLVAYYFVYLLVGYYVGCAVDVVGHMMFCLADLYYSCVVYVCAYCLVGY